MSSGRRQAFARARTPVAVAMRVVAAALAAFDPQAGMRRSVFIGPRKLRRLALRDTVAGKAALPPRGCEELH
ncbi:MAG: hypothetical protein ACJ8GJ_04725 [Vitreoscilla sp.]